MSFFMEKKILSVICFMVLSVSMVFAQDYSKTKNGVKIKTANAFVEVQVFAPNIVRVIKSKSAIFPEKKSLSVISAPQTVNFSIKEDDKHLIINTSALKIKVDKLDEEVTYFKPDHTLLMGEKKNGSSFVEFQDQDEKTYHIKQDFVLPPKDAIYGLGQHQAGTMNHRNTEVLIRQQNMEIGIPIIVSSGNYGIFWDNYSTTNYKDTSGVTSFSSEVGDIIDYYFITGNNADEVIGGLRTLTGQVPMFPKWAYGFWQSRERYTSQDELIGVVKKYRDLKIPLDGIVQDWQYWGENWADWNAVEFGNPRFPDPKKMVEDVHTLNAKMIISVWPNFGSNTNIFKEFKEGKYLYDMATWPDTMGVRIYDAFSVPARAIYWKYIKKNIFDIGIDGLWLDATEPEQPQPEESSKIQTAIGSFRKYRNAYPLLTTQGIYQNHRLTYPDKRVFSLTRSAFAGQQRNATVTWSGDIHASWEVFRKQIPAGLNISLSGIPYWNTDIGAFYTRPNYPKGVKDPAYHELYTRWMQFAVFTPMFRSHGTDSPREIFQFGKKGDWAYDVQEKFINLRYQLLPYIYSSSWEVTHHASTMMRALMMDFPKDSKVFEIDNQYMFGKSILVKPITDSMYVTKQGEKTIADFDKVATTPVYLPLGTNWIDFWTGKTYNGGNEIRVEAPIDQIPLFVKAGAIIPFGPKRQYTSELKPDTLELRIYPGANGTFVLYEDEGENYNYEKGKYSTIEISWNNASKTLTIHDRKGSFKGMLEKRIFNLTMVNHPDAEALTNVKKMVAYSGKKIIEVIKM